MPSHLPGASFSVTANLGLLHRLSPVSAYCLKTGLPLQKDKIYLKLPTLGTDKKYSITLALLFIAAYGRALQ